MKMEMKDIWMGGFHVARNCAQDDYDDESLYQKWLKEAQPSPSSREPVAKLGGTQGRGPNKDGK